MFNPLCYHLGWRAVPGDARASPLDDGGFAAWLDSLQVAIDLAQRLEASLLLLSRCLGLRAAELLLGQWRRLADSEE